MTAGLGAWWCFMGYQKAPLRTDKITRTLLALLWSGKQRHVNQPGLAGNSGCGTALALVHLPCYAWVEAGVTLPLISFSSFEILFMAHLIITKYIFSVLFDTGEPCHRYRCCDRRQKTAFGVYKLEHDQICFVHRKHPCGIVWLCGSVCRSCKSSVWATDGLSWPRGARHHFSRNKRWTLLANLLNVTIF